MKTSQTFLAQVRRRTARLPADEGGTMTAVNLVAVMLCVLLVVFMLNLGRVAKEKIESQNTADAVVHASALWQARALNGVTATNHVIGEVLALVIVHQALGGQKLDAKQVADTRAADTALDVAAATAGRSGSQAYETVRERGLVHAEATLLDSKLALKKWLTGVYAGLVLAKVMEATPWPWVSLAGGVLELGLQALEIKTFQEYATLNGLEEIARGLVPLKENLRDRLLPEAKAYTARLVAEAPEAAHRAAEHMGRANGQQGIVYPCRPLVPLVIDPLAKAQPGTLPQIAAVGDDAGRTAGNGPVARRQIVKATQLARATFPWVLYHRQRLLDLMELLVPLSGAAGHYRRYTFEYSVELCEQLQTDGHDLGLYVLRDYPAPDKGYAVWTEDPQQADPLFCTVGLAHRPAPAVVGSSLLFRQQHPDGRITLAQAIVYNGNAQRRSSQRIALGQEELSIERQADCGWDTLNWKSGSRPWEMVSWARYDGRPEICLNWQTKLVPLSANRLAAVTGNAALLPEPFARVAGKVLPTASSGLRTH